jgi:hypothetical protein
LSIKYRGRLNPQINTIPINPLTDSPNQPGARGLQPLGALAHTLWPIANWLGGPSRTSSGEDLNNWGIGRGPKSTFKALRARGLSLSGLCSLAHTRTCQPLPAQGHTYGMTQSDKGHHSHLHGGVWARLAALPCVPKLMACDEHYGKVRTGESTIALESA